VQNKVSINKTNRTTEHREKIKSQQHKTGELGTRRNK